MRRFTYAVLALFLCAAGARAQNVPAQEVVLDNGLRVLLVPRKGDPNIAAGWITRTGSVNERPGITGLSHLFEHMMFKGTRTIGTKNIEENLKVLKEMDDVRAQIRAACKESRTYKVVCRKRQPSPSLRRPSLPMPAICHRDPRFFRRQRRPFLQ